MTNNQKCKLSLTITKPGNRPNRLTAEITQEQAQKLLELLRERYLPNKSNE